VEGKEDDEHGIAVMWRVWRRQRQRKEKMSVGLQWCGGCEKRQEKGREMRVGGLRVGKVGKMKSLKENERRKTRKDGILRYFGLRFVICTHFFVYPFTFGLGLTRMNRILSISFEMERRRLMAKIVLKRSEVKNVQRYRQIPSSSIPCLLENLIGR
jgi:hypothetical protein